METIGLSATNVNADFSAYKFLRIQRVQKLLDQNYQTAFSLTGCQIQDSHHAYLI
ncbi:hypothetical protein M758_3G187800 [Ceratodon purpureus]|nr:hypothetical protein M758_3G187800 [Ceratodon purpureus]